MRIWRYSGPLLTVVLLLNLIPSVATPRLAVAQERPSLTYFALGDSYASGHGLPGEVGTGEDGAGNAGNCRRSPNSYPYLVERALSATYAVDFGPEHHLACSGATAGPYTMRSDDITYHIDKSISSQVAEVYRLLDERDRAGISGPVLVTITIGANDVGLTDWITRGQVSRQFNTAYGFFQWLDGKEVSINSGLTPAIHGLLSHENVYVILTDYPNPFPEGLGSSFLCNDFVRSMSCEEALQNVVSRLNLIMAEQFLGASQTKRLRVVSLLGEPFSEHPASGSIADCVVGNSKPDNTWFQKDCAHPNQEGAQAIADSVVDTAQLMLPAPVASQPTQAPAADVAAPAPAARSGGYHLPWEAGSVWQITSDNNGGNHADQYNQYAFDAVPDPGRSTPHVTAIADGRVLGFQADVPNEALFTSGHAGNCMMIEHGDGSISLYAHLEAGSIPGDLRREGAEVRSGMVIGTVGNTGYASGVHLHWSLVSDGFMYNAEGYRTCAGTSIPSQYADNDAELIEDGGVPRTGRYYESFNVPSGGASSVPVQPTDPAPATCQDAVRPEQTSRLTASPANADTTTEVMLSVTITNAGCETFAPTVLAIGGRDPAGNVTDPYQTREFVLEPGESRTLNVPVVLSAPGTHEFFMAHQSGGWHRIPDTSGDSSSIYVTVTEAAAAATEEAGGSSVIEPIDADEPDGSNINTGGAPTAQEVANGGLFAMGIGARTEGAEYPGHTFGARFVVTSEDGEYIGECMLEVNDTFPDVAWTNCKVDVPGDRISLVWEDLDSIPAGYAPVENPIAFDPTTYVTGPHNIGAVFQNVPIDATVPDGEVAPMDIGAGGPNGHEIGARFTVATADGTPLGACTLVGDARAPYPLSCQVEVPRYTTVVVTLDESSITPGFAPVQNPITFDTSSQPGAASHWGISFQLEAVSGPSGAGQAPVISDPPVSYGTTDIALITRDPNGGALLTDPCYVLVDYSIEGCDRNADGQVTFADIPFGTYTVRQTQTPAGYPAINEFDITVSPMPIDGGGTPPGVTTGFIVKQAPAQNAPNTRNVSVILVDGGTSERVVSGACVELVGASNVGCDTDLLDGQIDFLDVPAGGPYELRLTNIRSGYEQVTVFGTPTVSVDAAAGKPANMTVFVLLTAPGASGSTTGGTTIQPIDSSASALPPAPVSSGGVVEATVRMIFRGCPEGFVPDTVDPYTTCTIPLDAPDASRVGKAGVDSSLKPIMGLQREYDGTYIFHASGEGGYSLVLTGLEPVLRDGFLIYGVDDYDGASYVSLLDNGEVREIAVFYYYD
jgi:murein DD-endopeptidase MepM/ murein hydrolase activator NlpD